MLRSNVMPKGDSELCEGEYSSNLNQNLFEYRGKNYYE